MSAAGLAATLLGALSGAAVQPRAGRGGHHGAAAAADHSPLLPGCTNGVTGVQVGHSRLEMPGAFIGDTVAADWYFPTQADGRVHAQGVIWLQHGFGADQHLLLRAGDELAMQTNSIVVSPDAVVHPVHLLGRLPHLRQHPGGGRRRAFLDPARKVLIDSAVDAGYIRSIWTRSKGKFVLRRPLRRRRIRRRDGADFLGR